MKNKYLQLPYILTIYLFIGITVVYGNEQSIHPYANGDGHTSVTIGNDFGYTRQPDISTSENNPVIGSNGTFNVSQTGAATYTYNIAVPQGIGGMQPSLSVVYNSQGSNGVSFSGWNATASYNGWGLGFGKTYYSEEVVRGNILGKQTVGTISALFPGGSFRLSNDMFGKKHFDRWCTSAAELSIGRFSIGTYVTTNWGAQDSKKLGNKELTYNGVDPLLGTNKKKEAWSEGNIYSAPFWIGYNNNGNMYRIGYSHQYVQSLTQNAVHKYLVKTPFFLGTNNFYKGMFSYSGYNNPLSLW